MFLYKLLYTVKSLRLKIRLPGPFKLYKHEKVSEVILASDAKTL